MNPNPFSQHPLLRRGVLAAFLAAGCLSAEPDTHEVEDWVLLALERNPEIQAARGETDAARHRIAPARTLSEPMLEYREFLQSAMRRREVEVMQDLPWPGTLRESGRTASHDARAALYRFHDRELELARRVREGYARHALLDATLVHLDEDLKLLEELEQSIEAVVSAGRDRSGTLLRVESDRIRVEDRIAQLRSEKAVEGHRLRNLLGLDADEALPGVPSLDGLPGITTSPPAESPEEQAAIRAATEAVAARQAAVRAVRAADLPSIRLGAGWMEERGEDEVSVFAAISLPVFRTAVRERRREALALHRTATHELTAARLEQENRAAELRARIEDADRRLHLYRDRLLPLAKATIEAERTAYESGGVTLAEVLTARRSLLDTRIGYDTARAESYTLRAQYTRLTATAAEVKTTETIILK